MRGGRRALQKKPNQNKVKLIIKYLPTTCVIFCFGSFTRNLSKSESESGPSHVTVQEAFAGVKSSGKMSVPTVTFVGDRGSIRYKILLPGSEVSSSNSNSTLNKSFSNTDGEWYNVTHRVSYIILDHII